jgi:ABC-type glutathione transport system ATPase component
VEDPRGGCRRVSSLSAADYAVARLHEFLRAGEPALQVRDLQRALAGALLISHRFSTVRMADRIAVLEGGHLTELGTHQELLQLGGTYARLFNMQAEGYR